ncbi:hypothetical protein N7485_003562 [Penicillium canescens]|nr:hypothetical protein N7485_003562 [Penicillium canescens]
MDRSNKPSAIGVGASLPQPTLSIKDNIIEASLPSGQSVTVHLYGATVTSWKTNGKEQLFVSEKAHLDGSKPIRGGIPLVFPNHATSSLPQHGFARNSNWEFLGKSSSEAPGRDGDQTDLTVKLDFGLSHSMLTEEFREAWPYEFGLVYSVTLTKDTLETALQVRNEGKHNFEFQTLMHTYLNIAVGAPFETSPISALKTSNPRPTSTRPSTPPPIPNPPPLSPSPKKLIVFTKVSTQPFQLSSPRLRMTNPLFSITREALNDVVVWNPWIEKAKGMADFGPDEAYKNMICVEAGSVSGWQTLEAGEAWEGAQSIKARL